MKGFKLRLLLPVALAISVAAAIGGASFVAPQAKAAFGTQSDFVQFTLEGCIQDGTLTFPNNNPSGNPTGFVCPDSQYTTGNQQKLWNELDLVPMRLTTGLGNQSGATTDYSIVLAGDSLDNSGGDPGYGTLSAPVVNAAKSDASCSVTSDPSFAGPPLTGGAAASIARVVTIHQAKGSTCVLDWTQLISQGAHNFSGSSLQSYLFQTSNFTGSKKTVPLPVGEALPQTLNKDMAAVQNTDTPWNLSKSATPTTLGFGNVCSPNFQGSQPVAVTINWTKLAPVPAGMVSITTNIYAGNPAARSVTTTVTDQIYAGALGDNSTPLGAAFTKTVVVPANQSNVNLGPHTITTPAVAGVTQYHDVAVASYTDTVTGVVLTQTTTATASSAIATGTNTNGTATVTDSESMTGAGLSFATGLPAPVAGSFTNGYVAGSSTIGPVNWSSGSQSGSGTTTFSKTVSLSPIQATSGVLTDTAHLAGVDGFSPADASATVNISSTATTSLTINKTIPNVLTGSETAVFTFHVAGQTATITFLAGETSKSTVVNGIAPGTYTVTEDPLTGWTTDSSKSADLTLPSHCTNSVTFVNSVPPATATAHKVTDPAGGEGGWTFTLTKPDGTTVPLVTNAAGNIDFGSLTQQGQYTITETAKPGFTQVNAVGCTFTVNFPADSGHAFSCTITNRQDATLTIRKVTDPTPAGALFPFTSASGGVDPSFNLDTNPNTAAIPNERTFTFSGALANYGSKSVTEGLTNNWTLTNITCSKTNSGSGSTATVTVNPGDDVLCTFTNKKDATLTIIKETQPANSGADAFGFTHTGAGVTDFTLDTNGNTATNPNSVQFTFAGSNYGVKSVTEATVPAGWTLVSKSCVGGNDTTPVGATATVNVQPGDNVTCTYTNVKAASLTIIKDTVPTDSGTDSFPYTGTGSNVAASFSLDTHTAGHETTTFTFGNGQFGPKGVTEGSTPGWSFTGVSCVGDKPNTGSGAQVAVDIQAGDNVTCTYHNVKDAKLTIVKETDPANSGPDSFPYTTGFGAPAFVLDTNTSNATNPISKQFTFHAGDFGAKSVTEGATTGWTLTGVSCTKTNNGSGSTASVNIVAGDDVTCTFSNTKDATITVVKVTSPANSLADSFPYAVTGDGMGSAFSLDTNPANATSDTKLITLHGADATGNKTVIEGSTTGWTLFSLACTGGGADTSTSGSTSTIGLDPGENVVCTYTNRSRGAVRVVKQINNAPLPAGADFLFELRLGDQHTVSTAPLESGHATGANGGVINFTTPLIPGTEYAICELLQAGFNPTIVGYGPYNPADAANYWCWNFTITTTQAANTPSVTFAVENDHPQSKALTIGYWKNWNGCTKSKGSQADVLGQFLGGINLGTYTFTNSQADECKAVQTLSKNTFSGTKKASDPLFNMAAQLLAAKLNINAQAGACSALVTALNGAEGLLDKYGWNGNTYSPALTPADATLANGYATTLDKYNNNQLC